MIENSTTPRPTLKEAWATLSNRHTCPQRLVPLQGSQLLETTRDGETTALLVELLPGGTAESLAHLTRSLASFFDLAVDSVSVAPVPEKARRARIEIKGW